MGFPSTTVMRDLWGMWLPQRPANKSGTKPAGTNIMQAMELQAGGHHVGTWAHGMYCTGIGSIKAAQPILAKAATQD